MTNDNDIPTLAGRVADTLEALERDLLVLGATAYVEEIDGDDVDDPPMLHIRFVYDDGNEEFHPLVIAKSDA